MLILTRRSGESFKIGDDVTVTVVEISGGKVRLGVTAPRDISVHREEVYKRIRMRCERPAIADASVGSAAAPAMELETRELSLLVDGELAVVNALDRTVHGA